MIILSGWHDALLRAKVERRGDAPAMFARTLPLLLRGRRIMFPEMKLNQPLNLRCAVSGKVLKKGLVSSNNAERSTRSSTLH